MSRRPAARGNRRGSFASTPTPAGYFGANLGLWLDPTRGIVRAGATMTSWTDQAPVSNADDMTAVGGVEPTFVADDGGFPAINFVPAQRFTTPGSADIRSTAAWSFAIWLKQAANTNQEYFYADDSAPQSRSLRFPAGSSIPTVEANGGASSVPASGVTLNTWAHVVWVFDGSLAIGSRGQFYLNGTAVATTNTSLPAALAVPTGSAGLGAYVGGGSPFDGRMGEVVITKHAMTLADVNFLYNRQRR